MHAEFGDQFALRRLGETLVDNEDGIALVPALENLFDEGRSGGHVESHQFAHRHSVW
jgi:hypothetical protein